MTTFHNDPELAVQELANFILHNVPISLEESSEDFEKGVAEALRDFVREGRMQFGWVRVGDDDWSPLGRVDMRAFQFGAAFPVTIGDKGPLDGTRK